MGKRQTHVLLLHASSPAKKRRKKKPVAACTSLYLGVCKRAESTGGGRAVEQAEVERLETMARASLRAACLRRTCLRCCCCSGDSSISSEQSPRAQSWARSSELMNSFTCAQRRDRKQLWPIQSFRLCSVALGIEASHRLLPGRLKSSCSAQSSWRVLRLVGCGEGLHGASSCARTDVMSMYIYQRFHIMYTHSFRSLFFHPGPQWSSFAWWITKKKISRISCLQPPAQDPS